MDHSSVVAISPELAFCDLDDGSALIDLATGTYFKLNSSASRFCALIETPKGFGEVLQELSSVYDVAPSVLEADMIALAENLVSQGLVTLQE